MENNAEVRSFDYDHPWEELYTGLATKVIDAATWGHLLIPMPSNSMKLPNTILCRPGMNKNLSP
jgi:hypothetical protein